MQTVYQFCLESFPQSLIYTITSLGPIMQCLYLIFLILFTQTPPCLWNLYIPRSVSYGQTSYHLHDEFYEALPMNILTLPYLDHDVSLPLNFLVSACSSKPACAFSILRDLAKYMQINKWFTLWKSLTLLTSTILNSQALLRSQSTCIAFFCSVLP